MSTELILSARSFLFVPANRPSRILSAFSSDADCFIIDLEDGVPLEAKEEARTLLIDLWPTVPAATRGRAIVRINSRNSPFQAADVNALKKLPGLGGIMVPKSESVQDIEHVSNIFNSQVIIALIESSNGIANCYEISKAKNVGRLAFGNLDLQAELGLRPDDTESELLPARWAIVMSSVRAGLAKPIDGVTTTTTEESVWCNGAARARRLGFGAKLCIHPTQIPGVHAGFKPSGEELVWARKVVEADVRNGGGAFSLEGKMIDPPVVNAALRLLKSLELN